MSTHPWSTKKQPSYLVFALLGILSLILQGAGTAYAANLSIPPVQIVRVNVNSVPGTIDPHKSIAIGEVGHAQLIYEGLTRLSGNLQTVPAAAQSWSFSANGKEITFQIRPGLLYSDGSILNAKRFEYSLLRALDPATAGEYASILDAIAGAYAYRTAAPGATPQELAALRAGVQVHALDAAGQACTSYTQADCLKLHIVLTQPTYHFPTILSLWIAAPVKEELINGDNWWNDPARMIGNGPFVLSTLDFANSSVFVPNPYYWSGSPTYQVQMFYYTDSSVALEQYRQGNLEIMPVDATILNEVKGDSTINAGLHQYAGTCTTAVMFNQGMAPFQDPLVRAAFAYAFNRDAFIHDALLDIGKPTLTWIPPGMPGYQAGETRWAYDPAKAQQALAASSYQSAANLPPIQVAFTDTTRNRTRWQTLANQWQTTLGVTITLQPLPSGTLLPENPLMILGWCGDYPHPSNYLTAYWKSTSFFAKRLHYANPQVDALLDQAETTADPAQQLAIYAQAQDLIIQDVPAAFGWNNPNIYLVRPTLVGVTPTAFDMLWMGQTEPLLIFGKTLFIPLVGAK